MWQCGIDMKFPTILGPLLWVVHADWVLQLPPVLSRTKSHRRVCCLCLLLVAGSAFAAMEPVPDAPTPDEWTFKAELAAPIVYHAPASYDVVDEYGLTGSVETVRIDLNRFMVSATRNSGNRLILRNGKVDGHESYRVDLAANGDVTLTAEDDDGLRRAVCHFEDRVQAGDLQPVVRKPWLKHRISRCYFAPIKRPPHNRDELMDDVDYYSENYLNRLAHEGVNGHWMTVEWRDLAETSFTRRAPEAARRLAKLRRVVDRCLRWGIRTWLFSIEPTACPETDDLYRSHPDMFGVAFGDRRLFCPSSPKTVRYVEESVHDIFQQVPGLGGVMMISHGERLTTCFSAIDSVTGRRSGTRCRKCAEKAPWQLHNAVAEAIVRGMRSAGSDGEYLSWLYQPYVRPERDSWVAEVARHLPSGTILAYNFESGILQDQLGRFRAGGDYWLSQVGPAGGFRAVADAASAASKPLAAKIQVGNSHECATVPFVPVPGLLYRKYRAMRAAGVSSVLQCWYFGNYPGIMNKAAGELAFEDFAGDETSFLVRLAAPDWGSDALAVASIWKSLSDAYAQYPLSNDMQYYGPFHAGVAWPLFADVEMLTLGRTWKPFEPPSGDVIGECLENHTLAEARILAGRMAQGARAAEASIRTLAARWRYDRARTADLGVMRTLGFLYESANDIFTFYAERERAVFASRNHGDFAAALDAVKKMDALAAREMAITRALIPACAADSRLGFHSEAESHLFHVKLLEWRLRSLERTRHRLDEISAVLKGGRPYPESEKERTAKVCAVDGDWIELKGGGRFGLSSTSGGDLGLCVQMPKQVRSYIINTVNACGTEFVRRVYFSRAKRTVLAFADANVVRRNHEVTEVVVTDGADGTLQFACVLSAAGWDGERGRPGWLQVMSDLYENPRFVFPIEGLPPAAQRLNLECTDPGNMARILWPKSRYANCDRLEGAVK